MNGRVAQVIVLLGAAGLALVLVKLMYDMNVNMARMTDYVGVLSRDVAAMRTNMEQMSGDMTKMRESMQRMDANIQGMGSTVKQGGKLFQQWNPTEMMR
jgi:hypothetical protein